MPCLCCCKQALQTRTDSCLQAVDLSALGAQALAQVEKARKAVADQLAAAMNQKPRLDLTIQLDAPKIAIPVPATEDGKGQRVKCGVEHPWP